MTMTLAEAAKLLAKAGAILSIILGFLVVGLNGLEIAQDLISHHEPVVSNIFGFALGLVAAILGFIILAKYLSQIDSDPSTTALYLIIFGVIAALGSLLAGGALVFVAGILLVVEQTRPS